MDINQFKQLDKPELRTRPGHVYEVWNDGEITLQKSGELYGLRTLHQLQKPAIPGDALGKVDKPVPVAVESSKEAYQLRQKLLDNWYNLQTKINQSYISEA